MQKIAKGAHALIIALQTPAAQGNMGIPTLIWGNPGEGKSSFIEGLEQPDFPVLTLIASIHDPTDFSGLPVFENGKVTYAEPQWVNTFGENGDGILFLDEMTTAPPAVQAALLRLVLERRVGFHALPKGVRIAAAANPTSLVTGGWELSPPLRNRFLHLNWNLHSSVFIEGLENGFAEVDLPEIDPVVHKEVFRSWKLKIAAFLKRNPALTSQMPKGDENAFPTPRTWEYAAALGASCEILGLAPNGRTEGKGVFFELMGGCLGDGAAIAFAEFLSNLRIPNPYEVLDGRDQADIKSFNDSELYVFFVGLSQAVLERKGTPAFLHSVKVFLAITEEVSLNSRLDLIYPSLRKAAQSNLLFDAVSEAKKVSDREHATVRGAILHLFRDPGLREFITILGG